MAKKLGPIFIGMSFYFRTNLAENPCVKFLLIQGILLLGKTFYHSGSPFVLLFLKVADFMVKVWGFFALLRHLDLESMSKDGLDAIPCITANAYLTLFWMLPLSSMALLAGLIMAACIVVGVVFFIGSILAPLVVLRCK